MPRLADSYCNYAEAMTVFSDNSLAKGMDDGAITAKYRGTDVATGEKIEVGDLIVRLGTGYTHVIKEA